jgi:DNA/RNA endonuclease YhcR with UshA esterase domain
MNLQMKKKNMLPTSTNQPLRNTLTSHGGSFPYRWLLAIFVGLLCTNMANLAAALANDVSLTPIGSITKSMIDHEVTVQAVISNVREPGTARAPYLVSLTETGATLPLVYWSEMQPQLVTKVKVGNLVRVTATVSVYRDQLQLQLHSAASLTVVSGATGAATPAAPTDAQAAVGLTTPPTATVIGAIKTDWVDRIVIVSGTIAASENIDKTERLSVQDATGEIQVALGEKALSGLSAAEFQTGRVITITGPVKLENGTRTIVPDTAGALKLAPR